MLNNMRAVSFVNKLKFEINGNLMKNSLALGDVDNDQGNELAVGNVHGELHIFKGTNAKPWKSALDLGMITSVLIGDAMNNRKNYVITFSGEGLCYVFDLNEFSHSIHETEGLPLNDVKHIKHCHEQRLPANTKVALLADIDLDGNCEIVIGLTDRVVRSYRWLQNVGENGLGTFIALNKWEFASQIGSVSLHSNANNSPCLLVAQPGGTYVRLQTSTSVENPDEEKDTMPQCLDYHPLTSTKMRNSNITTEILGNIFQVKNDKEPYFAVSTLDGTLMLVDGDQILWSLQVDHQLFGLTKLDITGDGQEEIIVTSWDGLTYIVNDKRQSVRFQFQESVSAFLAGFYSIKAGENNPCLIYATFNNQILLYYDIQMPYVAAPSLIDVMASQELTSELLRKLNANESDLTQLQQLYHWCLYGQTNEMKRK